MDEYIGNKHFIRIDTESRIIAGFSDAFQQPQDGDILLHEAGYQFRLFPGGEENQPLFTDDAIPLYRYDNGVIPRTEQEIQADRDALPKPEEQPDYNEFVRGMYEEMSQ